MSQCASTGNELKKFEKSWFGSATKIVCDTKNTSIIVSPNNVAKIQDRANYIAKAIELNKETLSNNQLNALHERRRKLLGLVCTYRVGGLNDVQRKELRDRVEDAVLAAQSALRSGILPGGGSALLRAQKHLDASLHSLEYSEAFKMGYKAFSAALSAPIEQNLTNASVHNKALIIHDIYNSASPLGYNIEAGKLCNMFEAGVVDSCEAQCAAIMAAGTNTRLLISMKYLLVDEEVKDSGKNASPMWD